MDGMAREKLESVVNDIMDGVAREELENVADEMMKNLFMVTRSNASGALVRAQQVFARRGATVYRFAREDGLWTPDAHNPFTYEEFWRSKDDALVLRLRYEHARGKTVRSKVYEQHWSLSRLTKMGVSHRGVYLRNDVTGKKVDERPEETLYLKDMTL